MLNKRVKWRLIQVKAAEGLLQIRSAIDQPAHLQHGVGGKERLETVK